MSDSPKDPQSKPVTEATPASTTTTTTTTSNTTTPVPTASTIAAAATTPAPSVELREDLIKSAVGFLSSPNVRSADNAKKVAFLQKKGMNQAEIDEAFKRAGDTPPITTTTATTTTPTTTTTTAATATQNTARSLAPILLQRNNVTFAPQQVLYLPQPPAPPMPFEKVFVVAVVLGMGTVGITSGIIGIFKRFMGPIFKRIIEYKRQRYIQQKEINEKITESLTKFNTENDDLDAVIDQGEEATVTDALVKHQEELQSKLEKLIQIAKERVNSTRTNYQLKSEIDSFHHTMGSLEIENTVALGLKGDIRSLKALLLNRRSFPV